MDVLTFRTELETVLADHLGEYSFANGMSTPAISVRAPGESLPPSTSVSGLEAVILREPQLVPVQHYRRQQAFSRWTVYLVDWAGTTSLQQIGELLLSSYPGSTLSNLSVPRDAGPRSQLRVDIQTDPEV